MSAALRVILVVGALFAFYIIAKRIRRNKILMQDAIYWVVLAFILILVAVFPQPIINLAWRLGFVSPTNFVYLLIIALLLIKEFNNSAEISLLRHKVEELAQEMVLRDKDRDDRERANEVAGDDEDE